MENDIYEKIDQMILNDMQLSEEEYKMLSEDEEYCEAFYNEMIEFLEE